MTFFWIAVLIGSFLVGVFVLTDGRRKTDPFAAAEQGRPAELAGAVVVEAKTFMAMYEPFALHGEPDVIYRTPAGSLICREDKSGFEHPLAERLQLSVYGAILRHNPPASLRGCKVEPFGWVRYGVPGRTRVRWVRVNLFTDEELVRIIHRYRAIERGEPGRKTTDAGYCQKVCRQFQKNCPGS